MTVFILTLVVVAILYVAIKQSSDGIVYKDDGRSPLFVNRKYSIVAKPDLIERRKGQYVLAEYKDRAKGFYNSDLIEALAAALAVRQRYNVRTIELRNQTETQVIELPRSDNELFSRIESFYHLATRARQEILPAQPHKSKCRTCAMKHHCRDALL